MKINGACKRQPGTDCLPDGTVALPCPLAGETAPVCAGAVSLVMAICPLKLQVCRAARMQWHELVMPLQDQSNLLAHTCVMQTV